MSPTVFFVRLIRSIGRLLIGFSLVQLAVGITRMVVVHTAYSYTCGP